MCLICRNHFEEGAAFVSHPGPHKEAHTLHQQCARTWYLQSGKTICSWCDQHFSLGDLFSRKERTVLLLTRVALDAAIAGALAGSIFAIPNLALLLTANKIVSAISLGITMGLIAGPVTLFAYRHNKLFIVVSALGGLYGGIAINKIFSFSAAYVSVAIAGLISGSSSVYENKSLIPFN